MQTACLYDEVTREFLGAKDILPDEFSDYNLPAYATWTTTPSISVFQTLIYNPELDDWDVVTDYRNADWYLKSDGSKVVFQLGDEPNLTTMTMVSKPFINGELYVWDEINDPSYSYIYKYFGSNVALTGTAPLLNDLEEPVQEDVDTLVLLTNQADPAENGYYTYTEVSGDYTLTPTPVWIYDLEVTKTFQKKKIYSDAAADLTALLENGLVTQLDISAHCFSRTDGFNYSTSIPAVDYTFTTNVVLTDTAPLIQDGNDLTGETTAICKLTNQTDQTTNGYYTYSVALGDYTLTPYVMPNTPFYDGVAYAQNKSTMDAHETWYSTSQGAAGYIGIYAERKRLLFLEIDDATTGEDILAIEWIPF